MLEVTYHAAGKSRDDLRSLLVEFAEPPGAVARFSIKAMIREPICAVPSAVVLRQSAGLSPSRMTVEVLNYSEDDWRSLRMVSCPKWIRVRVPDVAALSPVSGPGGPRQVWRVDVEEERTPACTSPLQGKLEVAAQGARDLLLEVPVVLRPSEPLRVVPARLFFGIVPQGATVTRTFRLYFGQEAAPPDVAAVSVRHDLDDRIHWSWSTRTPEYWEFAASLTPAAADDYVQGTVELTCAGWGSEPMRVPVAAKCDHRSRKGGE